MKKLTGLLRIVGIVQIVLGLLYLFTPQFLLQNMGHSLPPSDIYYPLAMLASRFIVYGAIFMVIARSPEKHVLWIKAMVAIQIIDLLAGVFYTLLGIVPVSLSGFPMFNAVWIIGLLLLWLPKTSRKITD